MSKNLLIVFGVTVAILRRNLTCQMQNLVLLLTEPAEPLQLHTFFSLFYLLDLS